ncbi:MAG: hypothetical protein CK427_15870 [Leptospira sp.]|nr:MAG: hypothetical protein CK427_15870 [Leptospira sp.]
MESSKTIRIQTSIDDLEDIQMISSMIWEGIESRFQIHKLESSIPNLENKVFGEELRWTNPVYESKEWPKKIQFTIEKDSLVGLNNQSQTFQIIASNMGSITLRPLDAKKYPIFYMSLCKYSDETYQWENEEKERLEPNLWENYFLMAIRNYFNNIH